MEAFLRKKLKTGEFTGVHPTTSKAMRAIRGRNNKTTEWPFRMALVRSGISGWMLHPKHIVGCPDFYFSEGRVAVFLDGCFWHGCPRCGHLPKTNRRFWKAKIERNKIRDREHDCLLRRAGITVIRFWEHDVLRDVQKCLVKLQRSLSGPTSAAKSAAR